MTGSPPPQDGRRRASAAWGTVSAAQGALSEVNLKGGSRAELCIGTGECLGGGLDPFPSPSSALTPLACISGPWMLPSCGYSEIGSDSGSLRAGGAGRRWLRLLPRTGESSLTAGNLPPRRQVYWQPGTTLRRSGRVLCRGAGRGVVLFRIGGSLVRFVLLSLPPSLLPPRSLPHFQRRVAHRLKNTLTRVYSSGVDTPSHQSLLGWSVRGHAHGGGGARGLCGGWRRNLPAPLRSAKAGGEGGHTVPAGAYDAFGGPSGQVFSQSHWAESRGKEGPKVGRGRVCVRRAACFSMSGAQRTPRTAARR